MTERSTLLIAILTMLTIAACSKEEAATKAAPAPGTAATPPAAATAAPDEHVAKIPILPDYKYYVGGPVMKRDTYGRFRITSFNGEVQQPPSRGMIFGVKTDGNHLEYRVWANGTQLALHRGVMRNGLFWQEYVEAYRNGKLVTRERTVNDDESKRSKVTTEDIDPSNGEVIRTKELSLSYYPTAIKDEDDEEEGGTPPAAAPAGKPAAPTAPAGNAAAPTAPAQPPKDPAK